jgi:ER lumen protein retaining receptor
MNSLPPQLTQFIQKINAKLMLIYGGWCLAVLIFYHVVSDGDFSFLLTLAGLVRFVGFGMLVAHLIMDRTAAGVSAKSLVVFSTAFFCRFACLTRYQGYLPLDRTGDWVPHIEFLSFALSSTALYIVWYHHRATWAKEEDIFGKNVLKTIPHSLGPLFLIIPCFVLALIFHPGLNNDFLSDTLWTFALYLEACAPIPQLMMFQKSQKPVERWMSHFVFTLSLARILSLFFWCSSFQELNSNKSLMGRYVGQLVVLNEVMAVLVLADYSYLYVVSVKTGDNLNFSI